MTNIVRIGILGAAGIARKNVRAIAQTEGLEVVAIGSRSIQKAEALLRLLAAFLTPSAKAYGSYDEVLELEGLDAVYIPLPSALHVQYVQKAASRGLHILLEKPVATSSEDLDAVVLACKQHNVQCLDGTMWTHNPRTKHMEAVIRNQGTFGPIINVNCTFTFSASEDFGSTNVRSQAAAEPLGCLGDVGWYCIRAALWAYNLELPEYVYTHPGVVVNSQNVPLFLAATLIWPGMPRRRAVFTCSFDQALTQTLEVTGSQGSVFLRDFAIPCREDRCTFIETSKHGLGEFDACDITTSKEHVILLSRPQESYMWEEFGRMVRRVCDEAMQPDFHWLELARMTQQVVLAVEASSKRKSAIRVADLADHLVVDSVL